MANPTLLFLASVALLISGCVSGPTRKSTRVTSKRAPPPWSPPSSPSPSHASTSDPSGPASLWPPSAAVKGKLSKESKKAHKEVFNNALEQQSLHANMSVEEMHEKVTPFLGQWGNAKHNTFLFHQHMRKKGANDAQTKAFIVQRNLKRSQELKKTRRERGIFPNPPSQRTRAAPYSSPPIPYPSHIFRKSHLKKTRLANVRQFAKDFESVGLHFGLSPVEVANKEELHKLREDAKRPGSFGILMSDHMKNNNVSLEWKKQYKNEKIKRWRRIRIANEARNTEMMQPAVNTTGAGSQTTTVGRGEGIGQDKGKHKVMEAGGSSPDSAVVSKRTRLQRNAKSTSGPDRNSVVRNGTVDDSPAATSGAKLQVDTFPRWQTRMPRRMSSIVREEEEQSQQHHSPLEHSQLPPAPRRFPEKKFRGYTQSCSPTPSGSPTFSGSPALSNLSSP